LSRVSPLETALKQVFIRGGDSHRGEHTYFHDFGSMLADVNTDALSEEASNIVKWHAKNAKGTWSWQIEERNVYGEDGKVVDVRHWLVLSFDLSADAMLSRMTWPDLRRYPDNAQRRGRTREAC
jgi:hypothetical protein